MGQRCDEPLSCSPHGAGRGELGFGPVGTSAGGHEARDTYDSAHQLGCSTKPGARDIGYEYDDGHRQKAVFGNRSNRIEYTLDNAGTRTAEKVKDPGGMLRRTLSRSIDALGRAQQTIGGSDLDA